MKKIIISLIALLTLLTSCNKDDIKEPDVNNTVVTIDEKGKANGEHRFSKIDESNFYVDDVKYTARNGELVVSGYDLAFFKGEAMVISQLNYNGRTLNVVEIKDYSFSGCNSLTSVIIPGSVRRIGSCAFRCCSNLKSITIPDGVMTIGDNAFAECTGLEFTSIPNSVKNMGKFVFDECSSLSSLYIDCEIIEWEKASSSVLQIQNLSIGKNVKNISIESFKYNYKLSSIIVDKENIVYNSMT